MEGPAEGEAGAVARRRRRWPVVVAAVLLAVVAVGWWGWFRWLPSYRPGLEAGERYGVDVSSHQGAVDWEMVAGDGIAFAYIKATEGGDFVDERFRRNWDGAADVGLDRGAYHFFTLCRGGSEQAENFLRTVPADPDALPPVVDLELAGNCSERPDRAWVERELGVFLERVEAATGQTVVLYVGADFEGRYRIRDELDRPIWHRRVLVHPDVDGWWIWQFHGSASVEGIEGDADLNVMRGHHPTDVSTVRATRPRLRPGDTGQGVYMTGIAEAVEPEGIERGLDVFSRRSGRTPRSLLRLVGGWDHLVDLVRRGRSSQFCRVVLGQRRRACAVA